MTISLREKCPYLEFFWPVFSRIRTEYGEILRISSYSVRIRENTDQKKYEYGDFLRSVYEVGCPGKSQYIPHFSKTICSKQTKRFPSRKIKPVF